MQSMQVRADRVPFYLSLLIAFHIAIVIASNYLVQLPITIFGLHSTWGAFSFPFLFLATDLTVRLIGAHAARRVIAWAMLPALIASYFVGALFQQGHYMGVASLATFNMFVFRIALASLAAYAVGQLMDVFVFNKIRQRQRAWWPAPTASAIVGQVLDTLAFFSIAFWHSPDAFMAAHWGEIAAMDYATKLSASLLFFVPAYGAILTGIVRFMRAGAAQPAPAQ